MLMVVKIVVTGLIQVLLWLFLAIGVVVVCILADNFLVAQLGDFFFCGITGIRRGNHTTRTSG